MDVITVVCHNHRSNTWYTTEAKMTDSLSPLIKRPDGTWTPLAYGEQIMYKIVKGERVPL